MRLWDTSPVAAAAVVCADAGQPLTRLEWANYVPGLAYRARARNARFAGIGELARGLSEAVRGLAGSPLCAGRGR